MSRLPTIFRPVLSILSSILVVILTSLILILLRPYLSTPVVALLYLVPVVISAAFWGRLPGISASILSFLIFLFFFVPPYYTFRVTHPQDFLAMIVLLSVAVLISSLMARVQANLAQAQAREREAIQLYQLSMQLTGKNSPAAVAETLAQGLVEILGPARVQVSVIQADQQILTCADGSAMDGAAMNGAYYPSVLTQVFQVLERMINTAR